MGDYSKRLNIDEYEAFQKEVKCFMIMNNFNVNDIALKTGYSKSTVYASLKYYDRCSKFFTVTVNALMRNYEKDN